MGCGASSEAISLSSKEADDPLNIIIQYPHQESSIAETKYELLHEETTYDEQQTTPRTVEKRDSTQERQHHHRQPSVVSVLVPEKAQFNHRNSSEKMLRRSSPPSSQPHHTLQKPVFIQKIVPFAATRVENGAIFSSVSCSWQETMREYSGAVLCWKAFYDLSAAAQQTVTKVFGKSCESGSNACTRQEILSMLSLIQADEAKRILEMKYSYGYEKRTPLMNILRNASVTIDDIRSFFELLLKLGSKSYLQTQLEQNDSSSLDCALINRGMPLDALKYFFTTVKTTFGREFLRALLDCIGTPRAFSEPKGKPLSRIVQHRREPLEAIRLLIDAFKEVGGDEFLRVQVDDFSISDMATLSVSSLEGCRLVCSLKQEISGNAGLRKFLRLRIPTAHYGKDARDRSETLLLHIFSHHSCLGRNNLSDKEKLDRVQFLLDLFVEIGGSVYLKEQLEARNCDFSTSFQEACKSETSDLLIYFVSFMKKHCGVEYLERAVQRKDIRSERHIRSERPDFTSPFKSAIVWFSYGRESASSSHNVELLASILGYLGLFTAQYNDLSDFDRKVLEGLGINASFKHSPSFDEWFGMNDELKDK